MPIETGKRVPITVVWDKRHALIVDLHKSKVGGIVAAREVDANRRSEEISPCSLWSAIASGS